MAENVSLKIWDAIRPLVRREIRQNASGCTRMKNMMISTAYNAQTGVVGVREPFGKEILLPVRDTVDKALLTVGTPVWVLMPDGDASNAVVSMLGNGNCGEPSVDLEGVVRYDEAQTLSEAQRAQARTNIGAPHKAKEHTATLTVAGWMGDDAPYTQTVTVTGLPADAHLIVGLAPTVTAEDMEAAAAAMLLATAQAAGSITISAFGEKPVSELPIIIMEVG